MSCIKTMIKYISLNRILVLLVIFTSGGMTQGNLFGGSNFKYTLSSPLQLSEGPHDFDAPLVGNGVGITASSGGGGGGSAVGVKRVNGRNTGVTQKEALVGSRGAAEGGEVMKFPLSSQEPTCEQLRAMWIFSKRQSRAAEMTNEIPTYRDPFAYNVWEPFYSSTRSLGSVRMGPRERSRSPVFGRIQTISREPQRAFGMPAQRQRFGTGSGDGFSSRLYSSETRPMMSRPTQNRYIGGSNGSSANGGGSGGNSKNQNSVAVQGSFEKLKELIWTERAKELTQQRRAEEIAARAAVLKEIANGQNIHSSYKPPPMNLKSESPLMDENRSPDNDGSLYMNDGRMSIVNGQKQAAAKSGQGQSSHGINKSVATRYAGTKLTQGHRSAATKNVGAGSSIFSANTASQSQQYTGRSSRLRLPASGYVSADGEPTAVGVTRTYPLRQSHFRERNRSMSKQYAPPLDYFERDNRRWHGIFSDPQRTEDIRLNSKLLDEYNVLLAPVVGNTKVSEHMPESSMRADKIYYDEQRPVAVTPLDVNAEMTAMAEPQMQLHDKVDQIPDDFDDYEFY